MAWLPWKKGRKAISSGSVARLDTSVSKAVVDISQLKDELKDIQHQCDDIRTVMRALRGESFDSIGQGDVIDGEAHVVDDRSLEHKTS